MLSLADGGVEGGAMALAGVGVIVAGGVIVVEGVAVGINILFMGHSTTPNPNDPSKPHRGTKNGKSNWDRHSGKRSGGPEKKDSKMKYRKWKRNRILPFLFYFWNYEDN